MGNGLRKQKTSRVMRVGANVILPKCVDQKLKTCMFFRKIMEIIVKMRERKIYNYNVRMTPHYHYL